jgi:murein DD-endopeptidase MepM/ murein hydrolase activator NlpD
MWRLAARSLIVVAALSAGAGAGARGGHPRGRGVPRATPATDDLAPTQSLTASPSPCPPRTLPDGEACVRLSDDDGSPDLESAQNAHHDTRGRWIVYDEIPRRPDRPQDYDAYRYPVPCDHGCVVSGFDLDRPDLEQRRGRRLTHVGHGAVDLVQPRGTPIVDVALEHQQGDAEIVYVGPLFGTTVITRQALLEAGQLRDYLVLFGHLDSQAPGVRVGLHVKEGDTLGFVGDTGSPALVHLHLEVRRVREGVDLGKLAMVAPSAMIANENSVVCDPRNVLPLAPLAAPSEARSAP